MDKSPRTVDNGANLVQKFAGGAPTHRSPSTAWHRLAQTVDSTRSIRSSRARSDAHRRLESVSIEGRITEDELLEGYGLDPDDLELELLERGRWRSR